MELDLGLKAYKVQLTQEIKPADHQQRRVFAYWVVEMHENDPEFHRKIILSDESHFHLGAFVNEQNCWIWGSENPRLIVEKPLYPQRVTVWYGLWSSGVIGPYFFENDAGAPVTVNGLRYRQVINDFLRSEMIEYQNNTSYWKPLYMQVQKVLQKANPHKGNPL